MFEVVIRAFIVDKNGNILLARRAKEPEKGKWALVGGKVEMDETISQAIIREAHEELQISFTPTFVFYGESIFPEQKLHCTIFYFSGTYTGKIVAKRDEILETKFFTRDEIEKQRDIAWDHKQMLQKYLATKDW